MTDQLTDTETVPATEAAVQTDATTDDAEETAEVEDDDTENGEPESFSRDYVERLRQENGRYRQRAQQADTMAERLHTELVRATGRLADPSDLAFDMGHLEDAAALTAAIDGLLERKPHLASRRPIGDIGQGATLSGGAVDLAAMLRD